MNGIRLSDRYLQVCQFFDKQGDPRRLYQYLAADRLNIAFLYLNYFAPRHEIACCIEPEKLHHARSYPNRQEGSDPEYTFVPDAGIVSVYPHRSSFDALAFLLELQAQQLMPFYYMASSNAMLSFVVEHAGQEQMAETLARHLDLPASRTPDRPARGYDHIVMALRNDPETVATYVESRIKTYGIQARAGLVLCRMVIEPEDAAGWADDFYKVAEHGLNFSYAAASRSSDGQIRMDLVIASAREDDIPAAIDTILSQKRSAGWQVHPGVGMIHLQGPHFGDRYGIADAALSCLHKNAIPIVVAGCVGASVSIVLPEKFLSAAEIALGEVFQAP